MKFFLLIFCFVNLALAQVYKGELYYYHKNKQEIFAIFYNQAPDLILFDSDVNKSSASYLILNNDNITKEVELFQKEGFFEDMEKKFRIKIKDKTKLWHKDVLFHGEKISDTSLELFENAGSVRLKRGLDVIRSEQNIRKFHPIHKNIQSYEQIRQRPIYKKDTILSFEEWYYFYEEGMNRPIFELNNFVYDIKQNKFLSLEYFYDINNQKMIDLLREKLKNFCKDCFEDLENLSFNDNFLIDKEGLRVCFLPFENSFLDENICVNFSNDELKEFKK